MPPSRRDKLLRHLPGWLVISTKLSKLAVLAKTIKIFKIATSMLSMLLSLLVYGLTLGIGFAVGLVAMLFIHEMGHVIALRRKGLPSSAPVFIPFLGALIYMPTIGDRDTEAYVAFGGPLLGSIAALGCFALWWITGATSQLLLLVSYLGITLNLFNLLPISPMDGGRIMQAVAGRFKWLGLAGLFGGVLYLRNPNLLLIVLLVLDGFSFPVGMRTVLATLLWAAMSGLFIAGYGVDWFVNGLDVILGGFFVCLYGRFDYIARKRGYVASIDTRPLPTPAIRRQWLAAYVILGGVLIGTLAIQHQYLPGAATVQATPDDGD